MILAWAELALASSCCTSIGAQPATLASCDRLAFTLGTGVDVEYGGWSWDGRWAAVGDDGGGDATVSAALMGRVTPWLQGGARLPMDLAVDRLDGEDTTEIGLGNALLWVDLETPPGWAGARAPTLAVEVGLGTQGPSATAPGSTVLQGAVRVNQPLGAWVVWGNLAGRLPVAGGGVVDGDTTLVLDRFLSTRARLGVAVGSSWVAGAVPGYALSVGPTLQLTPDHLDRISLSARAGLPAHRFGQNQPTRFMVSVDWYRVLLSEES